jgi:hypothetical protein
MRSHYRLTEGGLNIQSYVKIMSKLHGYPFLWCCDCPLAEAWYEYWVGELRWQDMLLLEI